MRHRFDITSADEILGVWSGVAGTAARAAVREA
jgi:hypothetical protein